MRILIDFVPILIFVLVYFYAPEFLSLLQPLLPPSWFQALSALPNIVLATSVLIPLTGLQVILTYLIWRKIEKMHLVSFVLISLFGGLTIILQDKSFIQWKPTILNWLFALAFAASHWIGQQPLVARMMGHAFELPPVIWRKLSIAWISFFLFAGGANLIVAFNFSEALWVKFKLFGMLGLTLIFIIGQGFFLARYMRESHADVAYTPEAKDSKEHQKPL